MYVFSVLPEHDPLACIAILQSNAFLFFYRVANQGESRVIPQIKASKLHTLPYPACEPTNATLADLSRLCKNMFELQRHLAAAKTDHDKTALQRQIDATDKQIDALVYELYGLTEEEIRILEEGT